MNWKRTKISYIFWILYTAFAGVALWQVGTEFCKPMGIREPVIWGILGGVLLLGGLFSVLIWFLRSKLLPELKGNILIWTLLECLIFLACLGGGIYLRLQKLPLARGGILYSMAEMKYQMALPETIHMGENLYLQILHGFCYLLGNTPYFCIRFHLVLTVLVGVIWFFGVRSLSNDLVALVFAAFYFLDPYSVEMVVILSPEPLVLLFYGLGLLVMGGFLKKNSGLWPGYLFAGIYVGIAGALDLICLTLLIFGFSIYHAKRDKAEGTWYKSPIAILFLIMGSVLGLLSGSGFWAVAHMEGSGKSFLELFMQWWNRFSVPSYLGVEGVRHAFGGYPGTVLSLVVVILIILGIFGFFLQGKKERLSPWTVVLYILLAASVFSFLPAMLPVADNSVMPTLQYNSGFLLIPCLYVLAGIGVSSVISPEIAMTSVESIVPQKQREPITIRSVIFSIRRRKEERKAALAYAVAHPETMEGKNFIVKFFYDRARTKAEKQREIDKVMYALNSLSNDHVVLEDFTRDPYPEEASKDREGGLFHLRHHENTEDIEKQTENESKELSAEVLKGEVSERAEKSEETKKREEKAGTGEGESSEAAESAEKTEAKEEPEKPAETEKAGITESSEKIRTKEEPEKPAETEKTGITESSEKIRMKEEPEKPAETEKAAITESSGEIRTKEEPEKPAAKEESAEAENPDMVGISEDTEKSEVAGNVFTETENDEKPVKGDSNGEVSSTSSKTDTEEGIEKSNRKKTKAALFGRRKKEKRPLEGEPSHKDVSAEKNKSDIEINNPDHSGTDSTKEEEKKVTLLDNPLPVPKKHVTSVMDYDYEVSDDDDYDIKDDD